MERRRPTAGLALVPFAWFLLGSAPTPTAEAGDGTVRAVLFSSPTCPHCQRVREWCLPPLLERFGGRLQIAVLSTATESGRDLYRSAVQRYSPLQRGVPLLVIGETALVGSIDIPGRLPDLVARYEQEGGVGWPDIPGLAETLAADGTAIQQAPPSRLDPAPAPPPSIAFPAATASAEPAPMLPASPESRDGAPIVAAPEPAAPSPRLPRSQGAMPPQPPPAPPAPLAFATIGDDGGPKGPLDRLRADPRGNGLAVVVLVAMVAILLRSALAFRRETPTVRASRWDWLCPALALAGLGVAAYLAHVEVREVEAVCGPVGDCNTVQQSVYARLFGLVPIGVLGVLGFAAILVVWAVRRWGSGSAPTWAAAALLALTGGGTIFSIYLTFLEPFVIGATCLWCLGSAVIMSTLHVLALQRGRAAMTQLWRGAQAGAVPIAR